MLLYFKSVISNVIKLQKTDK